MWLDHQYRVWGAPHPRHPAARGGDRAPGEHSLPGRSGFAGSVSPVSRLSQLRVAPRQSAPAVAGRRSHQRPWRSEGVAAVYTGDGSGIDRSCMVAHSSAVLPGTTMAPGADSLKEDAPVEHRDVERLAWAQMGANRGKEGVGNRFGELMTG